MDQSQPPIEADLDDEENQQVLEEGIVDQTFEAKVHQMLYQDNNGLNLNNKVQNIAYRQPKMPLIYYEFNEDIRKQAEEAIKADDSEVLPEQLYNKYEHEASKCWDKFYRWHKSNFFKDRHYLEREIPELLQYKQAHLEDSEKTFIICEMGCGVGNTFFPLKTNYPFFKKVYGFDFSKKAIEVIKSSEHYKPEEFEVCVCDLVLNPLPVEFHRPDLATLIFVMSAISPENHHMVAAKIFDWMKPGSILFFRDYGKYDFGQINLSRKRNRKLKDNFYVKNDGVRVYYFANEVLDPLKFKQEVTSIFTSAGFKELSLMAHYRYIENRKTKVKMYRVWVQARYVKPE